MRILRIIIGSSSQRRGRSYYWFRVPPLGHLPIGDTVVDSYCHYPWLYWIPSLGHQTTTTKTKEAANALIGAHPWATYLHAQQGRVCRGRNLSLGNLRTSPAHR